MTEIIGVQFKGGGKQYYFDPGPLQIQAGQPVIVETARGLEFGRCAQGNAMVEDTAVIQPLRPVVRLATAEDFRVVDQNREKEQRAFCICEEKIAHHGLDMKLVEVEYSFEGNKILFFFTSEERVDFRALVKDLAGALHARIELRQIGVRDEAKMLGGLGICGRPFCCASFLDEFQPVSIKMAKTQSLSLNPTKISGTCGRLMCCLKYEQEAYEDLVKKTPKQESFVETPDGAGTVSSVNLLRQQVKVRLDSAPESPKCYHNCEICVIRNGKGKRPEDYIQPPLEELAKRRFVPEPPAEEELPADPWGIRARAVPEHAPFPAEEHRVAPAAESGEGKNHRSRRHRGKGRGEGDTPRVPQEKQPQEKPAHEKQSQDRPEKRRPSQRPEGGPRPAPEEKAGNAAAPTEQAQSEKKNNNNRHRRWRRRPPRSGGGQGSAPAGE